MKRALLFDLDDTLCDWRCSSTQGSRSATCLPWGPVMRERGTRDPIALGSVLHLFVGLTPG